MSPDITTQESPSEPWRKRRPTAKRLAIFTVLAGALGVGTLLAGQFFNKNIEPGVAAHGKGLGKTLSGTLTAPGELAFGDQERMNILLLGIDYNYTDQGVLYTKGARSDTMMVISLSKKGDFLNMVSVPRDTQVLINDKVGFEKINDAYSVGGPQQAMRTVSRFLGINVDHYVVVKVYGAQKVFKALGGLTIDVEKNMSYDDNWGHFHVHLKKGVQTLNAEQAIGYARFRMDEEGDRGRMRRQQQVIQTLVAQLKSPRIIAKLPALIKAVKSTLETDLDPTQMADLASLYQHFDRRRVHSAQIVGGDAMINGQAMLIPYQDENEKTVRLLLKDEVDLSLKEVRIEVLNGTGKPGTARQTADSLEATGFNVTRVGDAPGDFKVTQIVEHVTNPRIHSRLASLFPGATFSTKRDKGKADYVITLGESFVPLAVASPSHNFNPDGTGPQGSAIAPPPVSHQRETRNVEREARHSEPDAPSLEEQRTAPPPLENPDTPAPTPAAETGHDPQPPREEPREAPKTDVRPEPRPEPKAEPKAEVRPEPRPEPPPAPSSPPPVAPPPAAPAPAATPVPSSSE